MNTHIPYFHLVTLLFHLLLLVFFIFFDTLGPLVGMEEITATTVSKIVVLSLLFFLGSWIVTSFNSRNVARKIQQLEAEQEKWKAKNQE
jgi:uncharacterized membrane protein (DUF485 family)